MSTSQSALSAMKDLRAEIDQRLAQNEDYRALRALDKAILEVRLVSPAPVETVTAAVAEPAEDRPNPVGVAHQALKRGVSEAFSFRVTNTT